MPDPVVSIIVLMSKLGFTSAAAKTAGFFIANPALYYAANAAAFFGSQAALNKLIYRGQGNAKSLEALDGPKNTIRGEIVNARWVVGRARVPGVLCYFGSSNSAARMGLILSEGSCERIEDKMWIDGEMVELRRVSGGNHLTPKSGKYAGSLDIYEYFQADGTQGDELRRDFGETGGGNSQIIELSSDIVHPNNNPQAQNAANGTVAVSRDGRRWRKSRDEWIAQTDLTPSGGDVSFGGSTPPLIGSRVDGSVHVDSSNGDYYRIQREPNDDQSWYWSQTKVGNLFKESQIPSEPKGNFPQWTTEHHRLNGVSWVLVELTQPHFGYATDRRLWTHIPSIEFLVKGIKIEWPGRTTPTWTENAAAIRYWWETERRGRPADAIHRGDFDAAYTACHQPLDLTGLPDAFKIDGKTPEAPERYTINGVVTAGDDVDHVEAQMDAAWAGEVIEVGGQLRFRPGVDRVVTMELTDDDTTDPKKNIDDDDIIEPPAIKPWPALQERINAVTCEIAQSKVHQWTKLSLPEYVDSPAEDRDGVKRSGEIRLAYVVDPIAAGRLQAVNLRRARESLRLDLVVKPGPNFERLGLIPTDRVKVTNSEYGLTSTRMEVERVRVREDWSLELTLKEDHDDTYDDTLVLPALPPREIDLPDVTVVPAVAGLAVDEIAETANDGNTLIYLLVTWTPSAARETEVEVREKPATGQTPPAWVSGVSTSANFRYPNVASGSTYQIRARHVNRQGVAGDWSGIVEREVGGDLIPPGAPTGLDVDSLPTGFRATWTNPTDPDFAAACVYVTETNVLPENAAPVATVDADYYEATGLTVGTTLYVWVKAKDQSSNVGGAAGPVEVTPTPAAAESARIHLDPRDPEDVNDPNDLTLENVVDGNIYIDGDGYIWNRTGGEWVKSPVDIAGTPGAKFYTVASWPPPATLTPPPRVGDIAIVRGEIDGDENRGVWGEYVADADSSQTGDQPGWEKRGDLTGDRGQDGPGVEFIFQRTTEDVAPDAPEKDNPPTEEQQQDEWVPTDWSDDPVGVDEENPYEWVSRRKRATGEEWSEFSDPKHWAVYIPGKDGPGVEFVFRRTTGEERAPTTPTLPKDKQQLDEQVPTDWSDDPVGVDKTNPYEWVSQRKRNSEGEWSNFSDPKLWASYIPGKDGPGVEFVFRRTDDENAPPNIPSLTMEQRKQDDYVPAGWSDNPVGVSESYPYEWVSRRKRATGEIWSHFSSPRRWAVYIPGEPGEPGEPGGPGVPGREGPPGEVGEPGPKGGLGPAGRDGPPGPIGEPGPKGGPGPAGRDGPPGPVGEPGPKGGLGPEGREGPSGPMGEPGLKGDLGPEGREGPSGPMGEPGLKGDLGPAGREGPSGPMGEPGPKGSPGVQGREGPSGAAGPPGSIGPKGVTGLQGPAGIPGPAGDQVFLYYTNAPADTDPAQLVPLTKLDNGNWTTASGYFWYADATQVPD